MLYPECEQVIEFIFMYYCNEIILHALIVGMSKGGTSYLCKTGIVKSTIQVQFIYHLPSAGDAILLDLTGQHMYPQLF